MFKNNINWLKVEAAISRSVRGNASQEDRDLCVLAYQAEPTEYSKAHTRLKEEAICEVNPLARSHEDRD